jgi:predicted site-specific integrase-resolvase
VSNQDQTESRPARLEPKRKTAERFGVCTKTINRWVETGILSPPVRINGRDYFDPDTKPTAAA